MSKSGANGCMTAEGSNAQVIINDIIVDLEQKAAEIASKVEKLGPNTTHEILNEAGEKYMEIARLREISKFDNEKIMECWVKAKNMFIEAKSMTNNASTISNDIQSRYLANLGAAIAAIEENSEEAKNLCKSSIVKNPNGLAYETLGHIYHSKGKFQEAASYFKNAIKYDESYASQHKIALMYYEATMLAAMGEKEKALGLFNDAINSSTKNLFIENTLIQQNLKSSDTLQILSDIANTAKNNIKTHDNNIIQKVTSSMQFPTPDKNASLHNIQILKEARMQSASLKIGGEKNSAIIKTTIEALENTTENKKLQKQIIKEDPYKNAMDKQIRSDLCSIFLACQARSTHIVQEGDPQTTMGNTARILHHLKELAPGPVLKGGLYLIGIALNELEEHEKNKRIINFKDIATDGNEMGILAEELAIKIIFSGITLSEQIHVSDVAKSAVAVAAGAHADNTLIHTIRHTIKKAEQNTKKAKIEEGKLQGAIIAKKVADMIYEGKLTNAYEIDEKVNLITALLKISNGNVTMEGNIDNDTMNFSSKILLEIKSISETNHYHWKSKVPLEMKFVEYLSTSVQKHARDLLTIKDFETELLSEILTNDDLIVKGPRKYAPWQNKSKIAEIFLTDEDYFDEMVKNIASHFEQKPASNEVTEVITMDSTTTSTQSTTPRVTLTVNDSDETHEEEKSELDSGINIGSGDLTIVIPEEQVHDIEEEKSDSTSDHSYFSSDEETDVVGETSISITL